MNKHIHYIAPLLILLSLGLLSCEKEVDLGLELEVAHLVVDGNIEQGQPPLITLTESQGYFEEFDFNAIADMFVHDAIITMSNGTNSGQLIELCIQDVPAWMIPLIEDLTGLELAELYDLGVCVYTTLDPTLWGEVGKTYSIDIQTTDGQIYESTTKIPDLIPLDSTWFEVFADQDSLGFVWAQLTDPDTLGNAYRWYAQRINQYTYGENVGEQKDDQFYAPLGSAFDDEFFNGLTFEFAYDRGDDGSHEKEDDQNEEHGFFKVGDTVVVRFTTIPHDAYEFLRMYDTQQFSQGNPFAAPANVPSNISNGALGLWVGYGVTYDTLVAY